MTPLPYRVTNKRQFTVAYFVHLYTALIFYGYPTFQHQAPLHDRTYPPQESHFVISVFISLYLEYGDFVEGSVLLSFST